MERNKNSFLLLLKTVHMKYHRTRTKIFLSMSFSQPRKGSDVTHGFTSYFAYTSHFSSAKKNKLCSVTRTSSYSYYDDFFHLLFVRIFLISRVFHIRMKNSSFVANSSFRTERCQIFAL